MDYMMAPTSGILKTNPSEEPPSEGFLSFCARLTKPFQAEAVTYFLRFRHSQMQSETTFAATAMTKSTATARTKASKLSMGVPPFRRLIGGLMKSV